MKIYVKGKWLEEEEISSLYKTITPPQKKILQMLYEAGQPSTISTISAKTGIKRQYVSALMKKLIESNYVKRYGRRNAVYAITDQGYQAIAESEKVTA
ncbi:MAG: MarR family winged helix-turn-helix transcriptional regulator [Thermoprotei archaeon]